MKKLAVLVSGTGSILQAMIEAKIPIALVLADRQCKGIEIAKGEAIETSVIARSFKKDFTEDVREMYTRNIVEVLRCYNIELIAMAGYMTVFSPIIFNYYDGRILNIHPSLLPSFKGEKAVADALAFGVKVTGTTIHYATAELDSGPIIAQEAVLVFDDDTKDTLHERIKQVERRLYPEVVRKLM